MLMPRLFVIEKCLEVTLKIPETIISLVRKIFINAMIHHSLNALVS